MRQGIQLNVCFRRLALFLGPLADPVQQAMDSLLDQGH
jgi:hypothetical protein